MEKFIPFEKLSKNKKKELQSKKRQTWGNINPVTRKPNNPKAYKRVKLKARERDDDIRQRAFNLYCLVFDIC